MHDEGHDATGVCVAVAPSWTVAGDCDLTGNGRDDILWRNDNGAATYWAASTGTGLNGAMGVYEVVDTS